MGMAVRPPLSAGVYNPGAPRAPSGYTVTYAHNFTTQGRGDWATQPYANATDSISTRFGFGMEVTGEDQWSEIVSSDAVVGPSSFVLLTHYGTPAHHVNTPGHCAVQGTAVGWVTISMLRAGGQVTTWYGTAKIGTVPLPLTANQQLAFDNQDGPDDICPACNGPLVYPATAWLSRVTVWNQGHP
jgi:hypothetical protein